MSDYFDDDWAARLQGQRDKAAAQGRPYAQVLEVDLKWSIGAPLPTILQWEHESHLYFNLEEGGVGSIHFLGCRCTSFGPPGEEGHALEGSGWQPYTPLRVVNSPWLARMFGQTDDLSHFVFPFHDTTFECLAQSFEIAPVTASMAQAVAASLNRWD